MRLSIIIPIYNEQNTILQTVRQVLRQQVHEVVIINDGSSDGTALKLKLIRDPRVRIKTHLSNQGKGRAIISGINLVTGNYVLIQDADLEYCPTDYPKLLKYASPHKAVFGSRLIYSNPRAYFVTYLGNVILTKLCNILYGSNLTDSYTCFKLIPTRILKSLNLKSKSFEIEAEITAKLLKKNYPIIEVPIKYMPRNYQQGKKIKFKDAILGLITYLRYL